MLNIGHAQKGDTAILAILQAVSSSNAQAQGCFSMQSSVGEARIGVFVNGKLVKRGYIK